jgi:hypothetical protein
MGPESVSKVVKLSLDTNICSCNICLMFENAREDLSNVVISGLSRSGLEYLVKELSSLESSIAARRLATMAAIDALNDGGLDSSSVARTKAKASARKAKQSAKTAKKLASMPKTRKKLADGDISEEHADAAADAAEVVDDAGKADEALSGDADRQPADMFAKKAREWAEKNRPEGEGESARARQHRNRHLRTFKSRDDGSFGLTGTTDSEAGRELWSMIEEEADRLWRNDGGRNSDPIDTRTSPQRLWDALVGLVSRGAGRMPGSAGRTAPHPKYHGVVAIPLERYLGGPAAGARAEMIGSGPLPQSVLDRVMCDAAIAPMIVNAVGEPLWMGQETRTATPVQWRGLIVRDEGCVVCGADPSRCEAHHVVFWRSGGDTDITNMVLLCTEHHHLLHDHDLELVTSEASTELRPRAGPARQAWAA